MVLYHSIILQILIYLLDLIFRDKVTISMQLFLVHLNYRSPDIIFLHLIVQCDTQLSNVPIYIYILS